MERNRRVQSGKCPSIPKGTGSRDLANEPTDDGVPSFRVAYDRTALHIDVGSGGGVYLETPLLLEGETLQSAVEQATHAFWDRHRTSNYYGKYKKKNKRLRVCTEKKFNNIWKHSKIRRQIKCKKYKACFRNTNGPDIQFEIEINGRDVRLTPSSSDFNQYSLEPAELEPVATSYEELSSRETSSKVSSEDDDNVSNIYKRKRYINNALSLLDEVVAKLTKLTLSDGNETHTADDMFEVEDVSITPTNSGSFEQVTPKKVLADLKNIRERVAQSLATDSLSHSHPVAPCAGTPATGIESECTGSVSVGQTNGSTSTKVLADIKLLREMLAKSLDISPVVPYQPMCGDTKGDETKANPDEEVPRDQALSDDTADEEVPRDQASSEDTVDEEVPRDQASSEDTVDAGHIRENVDNSNTNEEVRTIHSNDDDDGTYEHKQREHRGDRLRLRVF